MFESYPVVAGLESMAFVGTISRKDLVRPLKLLGRTGGEVGVCVEWRGESTGRGGGCLAFVGVDSCTFLLCFCLVGVDEGLPLLVSCVCVFFFTGDPKRTLS